MARLTLLGVQVDLVSIHELNALIAAAVAKGSRVLIGHHNLHSVYLYHRDPKMRAFYERATAIHIDGMPLVYWGRLLGYPLEARHRVTYVDWVRPLMTEAAKRCWRVFHLGGKPGVADQAAQVLRKEFPGLQLETHHGYFDMYGEENERVLDLIGAYGPNVLLVGMGMPRQEHWVLDNWERIKANAVLTSGACFDYVAGAIPTPPRWIGPLGLEWFYRLISEPRRLWRRYLVEPWGLIPLMVADLARTPKRRSPSNE
ncbi:WecB/TagA/CpsF family glycosyltransferase [Thermaerobacter litoralis]